VIGSPATTFAPSNTQIVDQPLPPSVATCPQGSSTPEAYGGGLVVSTSGPNSPGSDIVVTQSSFGGLGVSASLVNPLPQGTGNSLPPAGTVSTEPADAWEGVAEIIKLSGFDTATAVAYVICGP
jgi:hypothetical protein